MWQWIWWVLWVKSSQILPQKKIHGSNTGCHSRQSVHDMFGLQSTPLSGKSSCKSSSLASRSLTQTLCWGDFWGYTTAEGLWEGLVQESAAISSVFNYSDECFNCHYPIFNPLSCELLRTVGAHTTWFCHLSGVWIRRNVNISIVLQGTQPLHSRWIEQRKNARGVRRRS